MVEIETIDRGQKSFVLYLVGNECQLQLWLEAAEVLKDAPKKIKRKGCSNWDTAWRAKIATASVVKCHHVR